MRAGVPRIAMAAVAAMVVVLAASVLAEARVYSGTSKANSVSGTKKSDTIRLRAGNDRARGRAGADRILGAAGNDRLRGDGGNDRLTGGKGRDRLHGGKGRDRLNGGAGNDTLNSADKKKDKLVAGGKGKNKCKIDSVDLSVVRGCGSISVVPGGGTGPGGGAPGGPGGPGAPGGDGSNGGLTLAEAAGLQCSSELPTCTYTLSGTGAETPVGTISGGGGVTTAGATASIQEEDWQGGGAYGCTADGYLHVTIGSEQLDIPVDCATAG